MHGSRLLDDSTLLICIPRLAMLLHDVDSFDEHAAGLGEKPKHFPFLALVVAAHHANSVTLRHVHLHTLGVDSVARCVSLLRGFSVRQNSHATKPPGRARRSSCTSSREARVRPVR